MISTEQTSYMLNKYFIYLIYFSSFIDNPLFKDNISSMQYLTKKKCKCTVVSAYL